MTGERDNGTTYPGWQADPALLAERELGTDVWMAGRIAAEHGDVLKFVWPWQSWMAWDAGAGRWQKDESGIAWACAKASVRKLLAEIGDEDSERAKSLLRAARRFMGRSGLEAALMLARSEPQMTVGVDVWDRDPHLLNVANGTIDLHDGQLRKHSRGDMLTKLAGGSLGQPSPLWQQFLARILPDREVRDYVQRAVGYSAIGTVTEHLLNIAWGGGANGKSVFCGTIMAALGDYSLSVSPALLMESGQNQHPTLVATLHGARFALASETEADGSFNAAQLKWLTGGDMLTARRMREDFWSFAPSHTLWLQTNHRPRVSEATIGFWRRIRLIPFSVTIPPEEQDKELTRKLRDELPGVLAWIVEGAARYMEQGLEPPAVVRAATDEYRRAEDTLADFIESSGLVADTGAFMASKDIHDLYVAWAGRMGVKPMGQRTLTAKLIERGFQDLRTKAARGFRVRQAMQG